MTLHHLLDLPWRPTSMAKGFGMGGYVDPKTGWAYEVTIQWKDDTEIDFGITHEHYHQMEALHDSLEDEEWTYKELPEWIIKLLKQIEAGE